MRGDRLALGLEDPAIDAEQVLALHAGLARHRAHEEGIGGAVEGGLQLRGRHDVGEQGKGAVVELHHDALERLHRWLNLEQAEHHGLVRPEELPRGDAEEE